MTKENKHYSVSNEPMTFGIAPSLEKYSLYTHSTFTRHDKIRHTYTNKV